MKTKKQRLTKAELSRALPATPSLPTISRYLRMPGAPKPDARGRYDLHAVEVFISLTAPRVGVRMNVTTQKLKNRLLELDVRAAERADKVAALQEAGASVTPRQLQEELEALAHAVKPQFIAVMNRAAVMAHCTMKTIEQLKDVFDQVSGEISIELMAAIGRRWPTFPPLHGEGEEDPAGKPDQ